MYYPCSENKGADQLRGYRETDLRLCFRLCKLLVFSCTGSNMFWNECNQKNQDPTLKFRSETTIIKKKQKQKNKKKKKKKTNEPRHEKTMISD